jgi:hypothetical protein
MAEPARQLPEKDNSPIPHTLRAIRGGGEGDGVSAGKLRSAEESGHPESEAESSSRPELQALDGGGEGDGVSAGNLYSADDSDESDENEYGLYSGGAAPRKRRFKLTGRRAAAGGGIAGLVITGIFGLTSIFQGPLEFVHIAQLMDRFHFSAQEDAEDGRLMRIARYIRDPGKPQNTRLGIVGNSIANKLEAKIHEATGLTAAYDKTSGRFLGYDIDTKHADFRGKSPDEIKEILANNYDIDKSLVTEKDGKVRFNPETGGVNTVKSYLQQSKFARTLLNKAGYSKKATYAGSRILRSRAGWTFHPVRKLDAAAQAKLVEGGKKALDKAKKTFARDRVKYVLTGVDPSAVRAKKSSTNQDGTTADSNASSDSDSVRESADSIVDDGAKAGSELGDGTDSVSKLEDKLSVKAKVAGGVGAAGLLCIAEGLKHEIEATKHTKAMLPMMRMAGDIVGLGSQAQSGKDISALQLGFYKEYLTKKNADGEVTSTWNQAQSIQTELGNPNAGTDIPQSGRVFAGNPLGFLPNMGGICKVLNSTIVSVFSFFTAPISSLVGAAAIGPATSVAAGWLSGAPVNPLAKGADLGNYINYGSRLSAGDQYASAGGVQLNSKGETDLKNVAAALDQADFQSKSIAYRLFNPYDSQTLAARIIDDHSGMSPSQTVAQSARGFASIFSSLLKLPASLFSGVTHAASTPYDYNGLKKVGFTAQDLADSRFKNPFQNARYLFSGYKDPKTGRHVPGVNEFPDQLRDGFLSKAEKCFGSKIEKVGKEWQINSNTGSVNMYADGYPDNDCKSRNEQWLRLRFWLLDTQTIEGLDCYQSDTPTSDQSCADVGFEASSNVGSSGSGSTGSLPSGSAQDLAKELLPYIADGKVSCNFQAQNCPDIQRTAKGQSTKKGSCYVDSLTPNLVGLLLYLAQQGHTFVLSAICSDHPSNPGSQHHIGEGVDFNTIDGVFMGPGADTPWDQKRLLAAKSLDQDAASVLPKSSQFGQEQCGAGLFSFLEGFKLISDGCHHQHIGVGK